MPHPKADAAREWLLPISGNGHKASRAKYTLSLSRFKCRIYWIGLSRRVGQPVQEAAMDRPDVAPKSSEADLIDVNEIRDHQIEIYGLGRADEPYTIYYDETNNIRRLHVRADGLNEAEPKCFVIGGVAHRGAPRSLNLEELRGLLRIQKTAREIKLEHIAKGDFLSLLKSRTLETFLQWLLDQGLYVHYSVLDPLYWSIVDIVDSILTEHGDPHLYMMNWRLKNALYAILRHDLPDTVSLFQRYSYPDVGRARRGAFVAELRERLEAREQLLEHFDFMMLKGVLQIADKLESLPYLEDETPNVLIDGFGPFFVNRICLFKNSTHVLDVEEVIKSYIGDQKFVDNGRAVEIHRFAQSHDEAGIQISDVVAGLLGKFFTMIQQHDLDELRDTREALTSQQAKNLALLSELLDRALDENKAFAHYVLSLDDQRNAGYFLDG
ncbi:DUF3800 domain-containing protein [Bradyrhizobium elkanii]|jgi:Protein of unknown function (DUF3800)|uniref:DUF3800 domain-containing protein n=2 Tax=Bradyrhizobium elkanii TaxID=29448 RepID=UPI00209DAC99|nr:DUF3800 domain-containing protein [Bradyrhizobium elkanii]MCP1975668.1 hypothetical protein [Bradyrhizobium elkanii]MCS3482432.1 hypothetical protein [Bradyrhizobium elkanii]MCS3525188.1 hypothetical protein [Bradyrhizobium elkanii]MCS4075909.1 hypothetical protein [Bradyrhizobium elkanii]MCS4085151.1 hypothetical protein [Bradyrhizobium elkanii]